MQSRFIRSLAVTSATVISLQGQSLLEEQTHLALINCWTANPALCIRSLQLHISGSESSAFRVLDGIIVKSPANLFTLAHTRSPKAFWEAVASASDAPVNSTELLAQLGSQFDNSAASSISLTQADEASNRNPLEAITILLSGANFGAAGDVVARRDLYRAWYRFNAKLLFEKLRKDILGSSGS